MLRKIGLDRVVSIPQGHNEKDRVWTKYLFRGIQYKTHCENSASMENTFVKFNNCFMIFHKNIHRKGRHGDLGGRNNELKMAPLKAT